MNPMQEIVYYSPKKLADHDLLKRLPPLAPDDADVINISVSIQDLGRITDPLKITQAGLVVDGRRRRAAALRLELKEVPCVIVSNAEAPMLVITRLADRAHYSKGQRAYLLVPFIEDAFAFARDRMLSGDKEGGANSVRRVGKRVEDWAESIGVTSRLLQQAKELREYFQDSTPRTITDEEGKTEDGVSFREFFEPRILREEKPYGLGGALTGIKAILKQEKMRASGRPPEGGVPKAIQRQFDLFEKTFTDLTNRFSYWNKFDADLKRQGVTVIGRTFTKMPDDLLDFVMAQARAEMKQRKESGK